MGNTSNTAERALLRAQYQDVTEAFARGEDTTDHTSRYRIVMALTRAVMGYERCRNQSRRLHPLTATERRATGILWDTGPHTVSEMARLLPLSVPATSTLIDRLVTRGFVTRTEDPADRRRTILQATPFVLESMDAASFEGTARIVEALDGFEDHEIDIAVRAFQRIYEAECEFAEELEALGEPELRQHVATWERDITDLDAANDARAALSAGRDA